MEPIERVIWTLQMLGFLKVEIWQVLEKTYVVGTDPKTFTTLTFMPDMTFSQILDYITNSRKKFEVAT